MTRIACFIAALLACMATAAQTSMDFASKFMDKCADDTAVQCITISPKMMEQLTKQPDASRNEHITQAMQKLKSARIVTASANGDEYYAMAESLLKDNPQRFRHARDYHNDHAHGTFYTRQTTSGDTVELVMLHTDTNNGRLVIVNLTGDIDKEFIESLQKTFGERPPKA